MTPIEALVSFTLAAAVLTLTPGVDTLLVLRTAAVDGARAALQAGAGISTGVLAWGVLAGAGLGALLALSQTLYGLLQLAGALYLAGLGASLLAGAARGRRTLEPRAEAGEAGGRRANWFVRGLLTNLLNPKVGLFYVSFLPAFIPAGVPVSAFGILLAAIHAALGLAWFAVLTRAVRPLAGALLRPGVGRCLDGLTGGLLLALGLRLALDRRLG